jgi:uncharacterized protein (TIGR02300 family)
MPAKDLGTKHVCWKCSTKFYDLKKADPACPKCGADPRAAPVPKSPAAEKRAKAKAAAIEAEAPEVAEGEVEGDLDEVLEEPEEDDGDDEP